MYRPGGFSVLPQVIKNLIILNAIFFMATLLFGTPFMMKLALYYPASPYFEPFQIVSHMFMHGGFMHFFFNMLMLWMFGSEIENLWGPKKFFVYYILCGLGAAALHYSIIGYKIYSLTGELENIMSQGVMSGQAAEIQREIISLNTIPVLGASGAVFGILLAFGMLFPNRMLLLLFPPIPVKAKYLVMFYGLFELFLGVSGSGSNIAHFAHIGGMLVGIFIILLWKSQGKLYN